MPLFTTLHIKGRPRGEGRHTLSCCLLTARVAVPTSSVCYWCRLPTTANWTWQRIRKIIPSTLKTKNSSSFAKKKAISSYFDLHVLNQIPLGLGWSWVLPCIARCYREVLGAPPDAAVATRTCGPPAPGLSPMGIKGRLSALPPLCFLLSRMWRHFALSSLFFLPFFFSVSWLDWVVDVSRESLYQLG